MREPESPGLPADVDPRDPTLGAADGTGRDRWIAMSDGVRLHVVERGTGPLVVLLHGFPQYWGAWRRQVVALADAGFHVVAPDLRGYNLSDRPRDVARYGIDRLARDVAELVEAMGAPRAHVVGHDWGGAVAWATAILHPERVDRLAILNAPHPGRYARVLRRTSQALRSWYVAAFQLPWLPEAILRLGDGALLARVLRRGPTHGAFDAAELARHRAAWRRQGAMRAGVNYYRALLRGPAATANQRLAARPPRITAPTLVLWGMQDAYLHPSLAEGLERWIDEVRVVRYAEASHWVLEDEGEAVSDELIAFLREA